MKQLIIWLYVIKTQNNIYIYIYTYYLQVNAYFILWLQYIKMLLSSGNKIKYYSHDNKHDITEYSVPNCKKHIAYAL